MTRRNPAPTVAGILLLTTLITPAYGQADVPGVTGLQLDTTAAGYDLSVSGAFSVFGLGFTPQGLRIFWDPDTRTFGLYGSAHATVAGDLITVDLGNTADPGLIIRDNAVSHVRLGVTTDFTLRGLAFSPRDLTFEWDAAEERYEVYGGVDLTVEGDVIQARLGTESDPGIVVKDGRLEHVQLGITADFEMKGLTMKAKGLTVAWSAPDDEAAPGVTYLVFGELDLLVDGEQLGAMLGDVSDPGLRITSGAVEHLNIGITSTIQLGGLTMSAQDLHVEYDAGTQSFGLGGVVTVEDLWSATLDLGSPGQTGVILQTDGSDTFSIEDVTFEIDRIDLGAIDFEEVKIVIKENVLEDVDLKLAFPEGWLVEAELVFDAHPFALNEIKLNWEAENIESAIEIGDTGVLLVKIEGAVANLDDPTDLKVIGVVGLVFGGPFTIEGHEVSLVHLQDSVSISRTKLEMDGTLNLGAYKDGATWHGLLGRGDVTLVLRWGTEYYLTGNFDVPSHPAMIEADAKVYLDSAGDLDALMDVSFIVPDKIPYVGGTRLGSVDGAFRYRNHQPNASYAAAWATVNLKFDTFTIGAKYNFGSRSISDINGDDVSEIQHQIQTDEQRDGTASAPVCTIRKRFTTPNIAPPKYYHATLVVNAPDILTRADRITVRGAGQTLPVFRLTDDPADRGNIQIPHDFDYRNFYVDRKATEDTLYFLIAPAAAVAGASGSSIDFTVDPHATLTPGAYLLTISGLCNGPATLPDDIVDLNLKPIYPAPSIRLGVSGDSDLTLQYWSYFPDATTVSAYWSFTQDHNGTSIGHLDYGPPQHTRTQTASLPLQLPAATAFERIYLYAVIDDGVGDPRYTSFVPIDLRLGAYGTIMADGSPLPGAALTLDAVGGGGERLVFSHDTDASGRYAVYNLPPGDYRLNAFTPPGYHWLDDHASSDLHAPGWISVSLHAGGQTRNDFNAATGGAAKP